MNVKDKVTEKIKSYIISSFIIIIVPSAVGVIKSVHTDGRTDGRTRRTQKSGRR
jgi:hypothetical protein